MMKAVFRSLAKGGTTIFMSTHTLGVAEDVCDRIGIIHRGTMIAMGAIEDLRQRAQVREGDLEEVFMVLTEGESV
jgi:ABC-2 type transport system ATP-binding protein